MIDIFGTIESGHFFTQLISESMQEIGVFIIHFVLLLGLFLLIKQLFPKGEAVAALLPLLQLAYVWSVSIRSEFLYSVSLALLLTLQLWLLRLLPLEKADYLFFFSALLFPSRLFNSSSSVLGDLWIFWVIFLVFYATVRLRLRKLEGNHFNCYFLFVVLSLSAYLYRLSVFFLLPVFVERTGSSAVGIVCAVGIMLAVLSAAAGIMRVRLHDRLDKLNQLGQKYHDIERRFFGISILILALFTMVFLPFTILNAQNALVVLLFPVLCLSFLWAQLPFILLLFRVAFYKDTARFSQLEKEELSSYYQSLSSSLVAVQEMRHDVKNIFFTMGSFVDRSDDLEMKAFFWDKIYPYSQETIQQSELLSQLYQIPSESLLAFFYLKISQAMGQTVSVKLEVDLIPERFQLGMDILDLTRILGILLDNAIEEAVQIPAGAVAIKIKGNDTGCSYIVKNTITAQTQENGVHPGGTSKGAGHGKGLQIVHRLLAQYPSVTLNASIQQDTYIQSLNIFAGDL